MAAQSVNRSEATAESATEMAQRFSSVESLTGWMASLVEDWAERENIVYSVAAAGEAYARTEDGSATVESGVFGSIKQMTEDVFYSNQLKVALARLVELDATGRADACTMKKT